MIRMPWIALPSGTPYYVTRLPKGAKEIPAPVVEEPKPEPAPPADKPKVNEKKK